MVGLEMGYSQKRLCRHPMTAFPEYHYSGSVRAAKPLACYPTTGTIWGRWCKENLHELLVHVHSIFQQADTR